MFYDNAVHAVSKSTILSYCLQNLLYVKRVISEWYVEMLCFCILTVTTFFRRISKKFDIDELEVQNRRLLIHLIYKCHHNTETTK